MSLRIALDLDMTLNNMAYTWEIWIQQNINENFFLDQVRYFGYIRDAYGKDADAYWKDPAAYDTIMPLPYAQATVRLLKYEHEVFILTHTPEGQSSEVKDAWIRRHFGDLRIIHSGTKHHHTDGCVLVDDNPAHVQRHIRHNPLCHGIVFNHEGHYGWAEPLLDGPRVTMVQDYEQLLKQIRRLT